MCRQNELWGWILVAFGAGVLLGSLMESGFLRCCIGLGAAAVGLMIMRRK